jgi:hypothetical protein
MFSETRKIQLIERVIQLKSEATLVELESIVGKA